MVNIFFNLFLINFTSNAINLLGHRQWQAYFGRTFDVYTKLWKFQQQHRLVLDSKYGLKRWQIGEIASKIGQLYYHY
jgi:Protein SCAI